MPEFIVGARGHDFGRRAPMDLFTSIGEAGFRCTQLACTKSIEGVKSYAEITVTEGKFHEVKRLFAALGNEVVYLKRLMV